MIILASTSPRRKQLLKQLGLEFTIVPSDVVEKLNPRLKPRRQAELLSLQKAEAVASKYASAGSAQVIVIGADTLVSFEDEVIGKPKDAKDAKRILKKLSGKTHSVITGFTLIDTAQKKRVTKSIETKIWFRPVNDKEINNFILREKPFDKAGAYAIHELGAIFVEKIEGDYFGAVGLPIFLLAKELKKFGIHVL